MSYVNSKFSDEHEIEMTSCKRARTTMTSRLARHFYDSIRWSLFCIQATTVLYLIYGQFIFPDVDRLKFRGGDGESILCCVQIWWNFWLNNLPSRLTNSPAKAVPIRQHSTTTNCCNEWDILINPMVHSLGAGGFFVWEGERWGRFEVDNLFRMHEKSLWPSAF